MNNYYLNTTQVNPRDYRAWYGIGQTYELLKMHAYCLYYYMEAQRLRPTDSRMIVALGMFFDTNDYDNDEGFGYMSTSRCTAQNETKPRPFPFPTMIIPNI